MADSGRNRRCGAAPGCGAPDLFTRSTLRIIDTKCSKSKIENGQSFSRHACRVPPAEPRQPGPSTACSVARMTPLHAERPQDNPVLRRCRAWQVRASLDDIRTAADSRYSSPCHLPTIGILRQLDLAAFDFHATDYLLQWAYRLPLAFNGREVGNTCVAASLGALPTVPPAQRSTPVPTSYRRQMRIE